jgi:hypothetical protein
MDARETEAAITRLQFATNKREAELTSWNLPQPKDLPHRWSWVAAKLTSLQTCQTRGYSFPSRLTRVPAGTKNQTPVELLSAAISSPRATDQQQTAPLMPVVGWPGQHEAWPRSHAYRRRQQADGPSSLASDDKGRIGHRLTIIFMF